MINMKNAMLSALSSLPACTAESFQREEMPLPIIVVEDAQRSVLARADGMPYLERYQARVDVYAASLEERDALFLQADQALTALGLCRDSVSSDHEDNAWAYHQTIFYKAVLCGGWIYQEG